MGERELEVLQRIAAGKSNCRITTELFVSVGTVKTHINNLYRKLDSHSRTQAVARKLKLLWRPIARVPKLAGHKKTLSPRSTFW